MSKWQEYREWQKSESEELEFWFIDYLAEEEPIYTCAKKMDGMIWLSHGGTMIKSFAYGHIEYNLERVEGREKGLVVEEPVRNLSYYWNLFKKWSGL